MRRSIIVLLLSTSTLCAQPKDQIGLSASLLGAVKHENFGKPIYGTGVDVAYKFNQFVSGHIRAIGYETDNWRGSAIDETSLLVQARLLSSANKRLSLSAIGGGDYDIVGELPGLSAGLRGEFSLTKNLSFFVDSRVQAWLSNESRSKDRSLNSTAGIAFSF